MTRPTKLLPEQVTLEPRRPSEVHNRSPATRARCLRPTVTSPRSRYGEARVVFHNRAKATSPHPPVWTCSNTIVDAVDHPDHPQREIPGRPASPNCAAGSAATGHRNSGRVSYPGISAEIRRSTSTVVPSTGLMNTGLPSPRLRDQQIICTVHRFGQFQHKGDTVGQAKI